jgi:hypothetical protein
MGTQIIGRSRSLVLDIGRGISWRLNLCFVAAALKWAAPTCCDLNTSELAQYPVEIGGRDEWNVECPKMCLAARDLGSFCFPQCIQIALAFADQIDVFAAVMLANDRPVRIVGA